MPVVGLSFTGESLGGMGLGGVSMGLLISRVSEEVMMILPLSAALCVKVDILLSSLIISGDLVLILISPAVP